jgi:hypothetical protein
VKKIWDRISNTGIRGDESIEEKRYIHLINQVVLFASVFTPCFIPFICACGDLFYVPVQTAFSIVIPLAFFFLRTGKFTLGFVYAQTLVYINLILASTLNYNIGCEYLLFPIGLISFIVFRKMRTSIIAFGIDVLVFFIIQILKVYIEPIAVLEESNRIVLYESIIFMSFLICAVIILNFKIVMANYEASIQQQKEVIQEKQKEIVDSIRYAKRIQQTLMPSDKYITKSIERLKN